MFFFFFKQKTAYEMRISDVSSDVCSSDLAGPVKIGCSVGPNKRRHELETWSPVALEIVAEIDGGFDIERRFHAKFQDTHERREWFTWSQGLDDTITAINAGAFDVSTQIGSASCRERGCKNGSITVV